MIVPVGYVPVSEISFWLAEIFNEKWSMAKNRIPPEIRNLPGVLDAFDAGIDGEGKGTLRRHLLLFVLIEKIENLYLCRPDLTVVRAGTYILRAYKPSNARPFELLFMDSEYRHIGMSELFVKMMRWRLAGDASDEMRQAYTERIKILEQTKLTPSMFSCFVDDFAKTVASAGQQSPECSGMYSFDELLANWKGILRNFCGDLVGTHLMVTDADAEAIRGALIDAIDSILLEKIKSFKAFANALALGVNESLEDRIIEEIEKAKSAGKPVKKLEIMDKLCKLPGVTEVKFNDAWKKVASMPDYKFISRPGPKPKMPK